MSRLPHEPTAKSRGLVEGYAACGTPEADIADLLDIDPKTLRKHYRTELDHAHLKANARVAQTLFAIATNPDAGMKGVTAGIFWMKTRGRWKETSVVENTGKDGGPIQTESVGPDMSGLTQEQRDVIRALAESAAGGSEGDAAGA